MHCLLAVPPVLAIVALFQESFPFPYYVNENKMILRYVSEKESKKVFLFYLLQ